jgi:hypothetical protein
LTEDDAINANHHSYGGFEPDPLEVWRKFFEKIGDGLIFCTKHSSGIQAVFTILLFIATIVYAVYARKQWQVMDKQLAVMQQSSEQSTEQVWKAIDNINWMARSEDWSQKTMQSGMGAQAEQGKRSANAAEKAVEAARQDQRAWMGFNAEADGPLAFSNQLIPTLRIKITIANVGHSPALRVKFWTLLVPAINWPSKKQIDDYCDLMEKPGMDKGRVYVPGESYTSDDIAVGRGPDIASAAKNSAMQGMISVGLIACVDYSLVFDESVHHQTRKAYQLSWFDMDHGGGSMGGFYPKGSYTVQMGEAPESSAD